MNLSSRNLKLIIGVFYLLILFFGLYYLFSLIDLRDLTSYEFIKSNKEIIIDYKNNNFLFLTIIFFLFSVGGESNLPESILSSIIIFLITWESWEYELSSK